MPDHAWNERPHFSGDKLAHLYPDDLRATHLPVQELDDPLQLDRQAVGYKDKPNVSGSQVIAHALPELFRALLSAQQIVQHRLGVVRMRILEAGLQRIGRPIDERVRRVIEHLSHHFAPDARVRTPLDLDERGDALLIEQQVIHRPTPGARLTVGYRDFALDQGESQGGRPGTVAGQQSGVLLQQPLQHVLGFVRCFGELHQPLLLVDKKDAAHISGGASYHRLPGKP